jgi:hypothetical protein
MRERRKPKAYKISETLPLQHLSGRVDSFKGHIFQLGSTDLDHLPQFGICDPDTQ